MNWMPGRQGTGYRKFCLARWSRWDLYILDYPIGTFIPTHTDPIPGYVHWRANFRILGEDTFHGKVLFRFWRLTIFRSDLPHAVSLNSKRRVVLSFGIALKTKN